MKKSNIIFLILIGLLCFYVGNRGTELYLQQSTGIDFVAKLNATTDELGHIFDKIYISTAKEPLIGGAVGVGLFAVAILYYKSTRHNYMFKAEHGSAEWASPSDMYHNKLVDKRYKNNMLLTQTERMSLNTRQTRKNNNVLVIGGSGSGKTRYFVKPNLMQMHSSYVVTDPKGTLLIECGAMLADAGYHIISFNTLDFAQSMHYNPFAYVKKEEDILVMIDIIIKNCKSKDAKDDFWTDYEKLLYQALFSYVFYELPPEENTFESVLKLLRNMQVKEENEDFVNPVDVLFMEIKERDPDHFAVLQYDNFKLSAGKTAKSVLTCAATRLAPFNIKAVKELTSSDDMHLELIGSQKTALFIIIDDMSSTYNFLAAMLYTQLFKTLCDAALKEYGGRLPVHVRCILDEFANIGQIPDFEKVISVIRSREISVNIIVQNEAQIKALYKDNKGTIVGNCDTLLFLGSGEQDTAKSMSEMIGKATIDYKGSSTQKGTYGSYTMSDQIIGRELINPAEVALLKDDECILRIRGVKPFKSKKFNIKSHKNYKKLSDYNEKNAFDLVAYNNQLETEIDIELDDLDFDDEI